jgi:hypothetical protein
MPKLCLDFNFHHIHPNPLTYVIPQDENFIQKTMVNCMGFALTIN